ncbi:hypothetical protein Plhal304r1_c005g0020671 [Plasmopara halstedii]
MVRKWIQLVGEDGNTLTSTSSVAVDVEDVDMLLVARAKQSLTPGSSIEAFGASENVALVVFVPDADDGDICLLRTFLIANSF